ncbi:MAG: Flp family type IVb pilin [Nitrospinae bacterium]|nr:Flp family type IVb pilin [Nitrospinota bacterium]
MKKIRKLIGKLRRDEKGVTALEYGLLEALIAGVIILSVQSLGSTIDTTFTNIESAMSTVNDDIDLQSSD